MKFCKSFREIRQCKTFWQLHIWNVEEPRLLLFEMEVWYFRDPKWIVWLCSIWYLKQQKLVEARTSGLARFRKAVSAWKDKVKIRNKFEIMVAISWSRYHVLLLQNSFPLKSQVSKLYVEDEVIPTQFYLVQKYLIKLCFSSILRPRLWTRINIGRNAF